MRERKHQISISVKEGDIKKIDELIEKNKFDSRSAFARRAILDLLDMYFTVKS